jgi:hypothetical protein
MKQKKEKEISTSKKIVLPRGISKFFVGHLTALSWVIVVSYIRGPP